MSGSDRQRMALEARRGGASFRSIGALMGIHGGTARILVLKALAREAHDRCDPDLVESLSARAFTILRNIGVSLGSRRSDVADKLVGVDLSKLKNCGVHTAREIRAWVDGETQK